MVMPEFFGQIIYAFTHGNLKDERSDDKVKQHLSHQKNIVHGMIFSNIFVFVFISMGYYYMPLGLSSLPTVADRLAYTIKWQLPAIMFIFFAIFTTSNRRFTTDAYNPIEGGDQGLVQVYKNILTNSIEAYIINGGSQIILTTFLEPSQMKIIPVLSMLFFISRVLFWKGYINPSKGRGNRAYGFGISTSTSLGVILYCVYRFIKEMFMP